MATLATLMKWAEENERRIRRLLSVADDIRAVQARWRTIDDLCRGAEGPGVEAMRGGTERDEQAT